MLSRVFARRPGALAAGAFVILVSFATGQVPSGRQSVAERVFNGSTLAGWHTVGSAEWRVEQGAIVGTVRNGSDGWLVLDTVYGNAAVDLGFECNGCEPGILLRSEKTANQTSGV